MDELGQLILGETAKGPNLDGLHPTLQTQIQAANNAYREQYGTDLPITSGARSREEQQSLYDRAARGEPNIFMPANPAKEPNRQAYHEGAVDISTNVPPEFVARMEKEFGLHRPYGAKDPVHWEVHPSFKPAVNPQMASATTSDANPVAVSGQQTNAEPTFDNFILGNAQIPAAQSTQTAPAASAQPMAQTEPIETPSAVAQSANRRLATPTAPVSESGVEQLPFKNLTPTQQAKGEETIANVAGNVDAILAMPAGLVKSLATAYMYLGEKAMPGAFPLEKREEIANSIGSALTPELAKTLGVDPNSKGYQEALLQKVGNLFDKGINYAAEKTGLPKSDLEAFANLLPFATPKIPIKGAVESLKEQFAAKQQPAPRFEPTLEPKVIAPEAAAPLTPDQVSQVVAAKNAGATPEALQTMIEQFNVKKAEAAAPVAPAQTISTYKPDQNFSEVKYSEAGVSQPEQIARAEVLNRIDPNLKVDPNVIEGRGKDRASDYAVSKTDTPLGNLLSEKFKEEKSALNNYGEKVIKDTGGTFGLDESANYKRGNGTIKYFQELENHFDQAINKIYTERDIIAKDIPVTGQTIKTALSDPVILELGDNAKLAKAATARLKQLGMMDAEGNMLPTNGFKAEQFRKWLNEKGVWDRNNAKMHSELKNAVDADVISTLDPNSSIYRDARDLYILKKNTLENPKGISSILEAEGPNKINRKIDIEKIPNAIAGMGIDQFTHILNTLDSAPKELQSAALKAKSEIKAQFANRVHEAFQRNANAGTKYLNENKEVMNRLFSPQEMAKFNDYNSAAHILKTDTGYPGAAVQAINVEQKLPTRIGRQFAKKGAASLAEIATFGKTLGISGTLAHEYIGARHAAKDLKRLEQLHRQNLERKQKGFVNLNDISNLK